MLQERAIEGQHAALLPVINNLDGISHVSPILDLGCGTGAWLKRLYDAGYRNLWGVDRDTEAFGAKEIAHFRRGISTRTMICHNWRILSW